MQALRPQQDDDNVSTPPTHLHERVQDGGSVSAQLHAGQQPAQGAEGGAAGGSGGKDGVRKI